MSSRPGKNTTKHRAAEEHIEMVARLEQELRDELGWTDRFASAVGGFSGTIKFLALHLCWFTAWFLINTGQIPGIQAFDPYPFVLLTMLVSMEAVLLSTFVLMMQNQMTRESDHRGHLNLQVDLLAEREITKILQIQQVICHHLGISRLSEDPELLELSEEKSVELLARNLKAKLGSMTPEAAGRDRKVA